MNLRRRTLVLALGLAPFGALAQARPMAGLDYTELKPAQPVETQGKIEVLEFFWYGCPHCYTLEPLLEKWIPTLPADAQFRRVPAVFNNPAWARDAGIYYAFDALGVVGKLHRPFFDAIHRDRLRTDNAQALNAWLEKHGVDPKKFETTVKSFGVQSKTKRAIRMTSGYQIDGTPAMAVHGRYIVGASDGMLATVNHLVATIRKPK